MRIAKEALPFAAGWLMLGAALALWTWWASLVPLALLTFTLYFFRDPERTPPAEPNAVVSPADGRIIRAKDGRVSVFLNLFDVHVCRAPFTGRIAAVRHEPGRFLAAFKDEASEQNERTAIDVETARGRFTFTLIAGLVARRIVCRVAPGRVVTAGERVGLIRFGSRVDVQLPGDSRPVVRVGDRVVAGETVIARIDPQGSRMI